MARRAARLASDQNELAADQKKAKTYNGQQANTYYMKRAKTYYEKLVVLCRQADSIRPEIEEAKAFLASVNVKDSASTQ